HRRPAQPAAGRECRHQLGDRPRDDPGRHPGGGGRLPGQHHPQGMLPADVGASLGEPRVKPGGGERREGPGADLSVTLDHTVWIVLLEALTGCRLDIPTLQLANLSTGIDTIQTQVQTVAPAYTLALVSAKMSTSCA